SEYGKFKKEDLVSSILRIRKRLGGLNTKNAVNYILEDNLKESFRILLQYYDKYYHHGLYDRQNLDQLLTKIACDRVDTEENSRKINAHKQLADGIRTGN